MGVCLEQQARISLTQSTTQEKSVPVRKRTMHKRLAHPFDVLERLAEQFENTLHWSDPPRLSEWARFILHAYIFLGVSLLLFPLFLLREVRYPFCFRQRWVAALLLLVASLARKQTA